MSTIMIVEDDQSTLALLGRLVTSWGIDPVLIDDGAVAEDFIDHARELPRLVLLDQILPRCSGLELLQKMRDDDRWKHVPVIMVSIKSKESDIVEAFQLGVNDYVVKPFSPAQIFALIHRLSSH